MNPANSEIWEKFKAEKEEKKLELFVLETFRFNNPTGPFIPRIVLQDHVINEGKVQHSATRNVAQFFSKFTPPCGPPIALIAGVKRSVRPYNTLNTCANAYILILL